MGAPGLPELLIIFVVVLLLFGGRKLPQLGGAIGESIRNFRKGIGDPDGRGEAAAKPLHPGVTLPEQPEKLSDKGGVL